MTAECRFNGVSTYLVGSRDPPFFNCDCLYVDHKRNTVPYAIYFSISLHLENQSNSLLPLDGVHMTILIGVYLFFKLYSSLLCVLFCIMCNLCNCVLGVNGWLVRQTFHIFPPRSDMGVNSDGCLFVDIYSCLFMFIHVYQLCITCDSEYFETLKHACLFYH